MTSKAFQKYQNINNWLILLKQMRESSDYSSFIQIITRQSSLVTTSQFARQLVGKQPRITSREILTAYLIKYYPHEIFLCQSTQELRNITVQLKEISHQLIDSLQDQKPQQFLNLSKDYTQLLKEWKKQDLKENIENLCQAYHEINKIKEITRNLGLGVVQKSIVQQFQMFGVGPEETTKLLQEYEYKESQTMLNVVYWNSLKEDLSKSPPDLKKLPKLVQEYKTRCIELIKDKPELVKETNEIFSDTKIDKLIREKELSVENFLQMAIHFVKIIDSFESIETVEWSVNLNRHLYLPVMYAEMIPNFFMRLDTLLLELEKDK